MLGVPTSIQLDDAVDASLYNHYVGTFARQLARNAKPTLNVGCASSTRTASARKMTECWWDSTLIR